MSRSLPKIAAILVALLSFTSLVGPASAQQSEAAKRAEASPAKQPTLEEQLRHVYDEAVAEEAVTLDAYRASVERTEALDGEIVELNAAIETVSGYLAAGQVKVEQAQDRLAAGEARLRETEIELAAHRLTLQKKAVSAYISGNQSQLRLQTILGSKDVNDLEPSRAYTDVVIDEQLAAVDRVKRLEAEMSALRDQLVADEQAVRAEAGAVHGARRADPEAERSRSAAGRARGRDSSPGGALERGPVAQGRLSRAHSCLATRE